MSEIERTAVISSQLAIIGLLAVAPTVSVFANVPVGSEAPRGNQHTWNNMYEAYENGDWEVLAEAAMG